MADSKVDLLFDWDEKGLKQYLKGSRDAIDLTEELKSEIEALEKAAALEKARKGSKAYQQALKELEGQGEKTTETQVKFRAEMITAANAAIELAQKVAQAAAAMWEFAKAGAEANTVLASWERIGGTVEQLERLKVATAGVVTETELQQWALWAHELGLTQAQLESASRFVVKTADDMGKLGEVSSLMEGALKGGAEAVEALGVRLDMSSGAFAGLTEAQKKTQIFQELVNRGVKIGAEEMHSQSIAIRQVETRMLDLESTAQQYIATILTSEQVQGALHRAVDQLNTVFSENKDTIGQLISEGLAALLEILPVMLDSLSASAELLATLAPLFKGLGATIKVTTLPLQALNAVFEVLGDLEEMVSEQSETLGLVFRAMLSPLSLAGDAVDALGDAYDRLFGETTSLTAATRELTQAHEDQAEAMARTARWKEHNAVLDEQRKKLEAANKAEADLWRASQDRARATKEADLAPKKSTRGGGAKGVDPNIEYLRRLLIDDRPALEQAHEWLLSAQDELAAKVEETSARWVAAQEEQAQATWAGMKSGAGAIWAGLGELQQAGAERIEMWHAMRDAEAEANAASVSGMMGLGSVAGQYLSELGAAGWAQAGLGAALEFAEAARSLAGGTFGVPDPWGAARHIAAGGKFLVAQAFAGSMGGGGGGGGVSSGGGGSSYSPSAMATAAAPTLATEEGAMATREEVVIQLRDREIGRMVPGSMNRAARRGGVKIDARTIADRGRPFT